MFVLAAIQIFAGRTIKVDRTSLSLLLFVIGFSEAQLTNLGQCTAYCTQNGEQKDAFSCPPSFNDTANKNRFCCGSAVYKYCCSNPLDLAPYNSNTHCANKIKYDWIIIVTIVITVVMFALGLTACLCLCKKKCGCKNVVCSETGELPSFSEVPPESAAPPSSTAASDFDPTSPCAFAPPAYDGLSKDPPPYAEVFTISNGCNYTDPPSNQTLTNSQNLESICNSMNENNQPLPEYTDSIHPEVAVPRGSVEPPRASSTLDPCPPYEPPPYTISLNPPSVTPPSYSSRSTRSSVHRPSLSLAMELHPLNLGVAGSRLSSPAQARVFPVAV